MSFATPEDLSIYLTGVENETPAWIAQAQLFLDMIAEDIKAAAGQDIEAGTGTHLLPGTWNRDLVLPQRPVTAVTTVKVNGLTLVAGEYAWNDRQLLRRAADSLAFDGVDHEDWAEHGPQGASWRSGRHWGGPASTVHVTYAWGHATVPGFLKSLSLRVAARSIGNAGAVSSEQLGIYSVQYRNTAANGTHLTDAEIAHLRRALGAPAGGTIEATAR